MLGLRRQPLLCRFELNGPDEASAGARVSEDRMRRAQRPPRAGMLRAAKWWMPTAAMTLLSLLSYVDRNVLALLSQTILPGGRA